MCGGGDHFILVRMLGIPKVGKSSATGRLLNITTVFKHKESGRFDKSQNTKFSPIVCA